MIGNNNPETVRDRMSVSINH